MTTYRLADAYGSEEEFETDGEMAAIAKAADVLASWWDTAGDQDETRILRASLTVLDDEDGAIPITEVKVTVDPVEPPCTAQVDEHEVPGHMWHSGEVREHGGGVTWTDECARCGLRYTTDTWHTDPQTGETFRWEKYEPAEAREDEEGS